jgi:hypothetical protein
MTEKRISYGKRTFGEIKEELIGFVRQFYPDLLKDFTDSSIGTLLLELNAAVVDNLGVNLDRAFQETQLQHAQQRRSVLNIAENMGLNIPGKRPSATVVDFTVTVPVKGDQPDTDYLPVILPNSQVQGNGNIFETEDIIDFNSKVSSLGDGNRAIEPNYDNNGIIISYNIVKREVVKNGSTNIYKKIIRAADVKEFYELVLPDDNVLDIESIILLEGTDYDGTPTDADFNNHEYRFYEVDYLAQQKVFVDDPNGETYDGDTNIKAGKWINITKKFIKEFSTNGSCVITFGGGDTETGDFLTSFQEVGVNNNLFLDSFLKNTALGEMLKADHTLFVKYRVGGGSISNVPANSITNVGNFTMQINGSRQDFNKAVRDSLTVNNPIAAIGGNDGLSVDQIKYLTKYNFSSQNRDTTINDYLFRVYSIPGRYGAPFRSNAFRENNKIVIPIISLNSSGKLLNSSNTILKENLAEYMSGYRMVNDYIEIRDGRIFNLACDAEIYINNDIENNIANNIINTIIEFFNVQNRTINEDVFIGELTKMLNDVDGVVNVISLKFYNKVGGDYSANPVTQDLLSEVTGEIKLVNNTIYSTKDGMFEIKYPERDIRVYLRKKNIIEE